MSSLCTDHLNIHIHFVDECGMVQKRTRAAKVAARLRDGWLYSIPRVLWMPMLGAFIGSFFILVAVLPTFYIGFQSHGVPSRIIACMGHVHTMPCVYSQRCGPTIATRWMGIDRQNNLVECPGLGRNGHRNAVWCHSLRHVE